MLYEDFVSTFINELQLSIGNEVEIERTTATKVNEIKDAIVVKGADDSSKEKTIAPMLYLSDSWSKYQAGESIHDIAEKTAIIIRDTKNSAPSIPKLDRESFRKNLYCTVVNREKNTELLKKAVNEPFNDLAVIPRYRISDEASFIVNKDYCSHLGMTQDEIMEYARSNTDKEDFKCQSIIEVLRNLYIKEGLPEDLIPDDLTMSNDGPIYCLTNKTQIDGAAAIISTKALDNAFEMIKTYHPTMTKVYVIGSSRHELILVPDDVTNDINELKQIHMDVQAHELEECDKLTEHVYFYDPITRELSIADKPILEKPASERELEKVLSHGRCR